MDTSRKKDPKDPKKYFLIVKRNVSCASVNVTMKQPLGQQACLADLVSRLLFQVPRCQSTRSRTVGFIVVHVLQETVYFMSGHISYHLNANFELAKNH